MIAPRIGCRQVPFMDEAVRRAAAVAAEMELAGCPRTGISHKGPEKGERRVIPDLLEGIQEDIAEQELFPAEEEVAGIDRAVRKNAELRSAGWTADMCEFGVRLDVRQKSRTEDGADRIIPEPALNDSEEPVKGH